MYDTYLKGPIFPMIFRVLHLCARYFLLLGSVSSITECRCDIAWIYVTCCSMAALLSKFRIDYSDVIVIDDVTKKAEQSTRDTFNEMIKPFKKDDESDIPGWCRGRDAYGDA